MSRANDTYTSMSRSPGWWRALKFRIGENGARDVILRAGEVPHSL
jgi:hypothetical protein